MMLSERDAAIVSAVADSGIPLREIGRRFGLTCERIRRIAADHGVRRGYPRCDPALIERGLDLMRRGLRLSHAAQAVGVTYTTLRSYAVARGLHHQVDERDPWTPREDLEICRRYLVDSAATIARDIGRTRNEVIGRAYRLGLGRRSRHAA